MPTYEFECPKCEAIDDFVLPIALRDEPQVCPECSGPVQRIVSPVPATGALWSKPIKVGHETFETNAAFREACRKQEADGFAPVEKTDSRFRALRESLAERADKNAERQGFKSARDRTNRWRKRRGLPPK